MEVRDIPPESRWPPGVSVSSEAALQAEVQRCGRPSAATRGGGLKAFQNCFDKISITPMTLLSHRENNRGEEGGVREFVVAGIKYLGQPENAI